MIIATVLQELGQASRPFSIVMAGGTKLSAVLIVLTVFETRIFFRAELFEFGHCLHQFFTLSGNLLLNL